MARTTPNRTLLAALGFGVIVACGVVAATSTATANRLSGASRAAAQANIAVVDISTVIDELDEQAALQAELQGLIDEAQAELDTQTGLITRLESDLEMLTLGTPDHTRKALEIREARVLLQAKQESVQAFISEQTGSRLLRLYGKVREAVERIAGRDGFDLVLIDDSGVRLPAAGQQQQVLGFINGRRVLYASDNVDITDLVTADMNNRFNAGR